MQKRRYEFKNRQGINLVDLRLYEEFITECYKTISKDIHVKCVQNSYYVEGDITSKELRIVGKMIAKHPDLGRFAVKCGTGRCVFRCCEYEEV